MHEVSTAVESRDLVEMARPRFVFVERRIGPETQSTVTVAPDLPRSFVVIAGQVTVRAAGAEPTTHGYLAGWRAEPGTTVEIRNDGPTAALVLEAGPTEAAGTPDGSGTGTGPVGPISPLSGYTVRKPWGHEVWYTQNRPGARYAVKQIFMTRGNRSSLQSHRYKAETNFVVEGSARVLNGTYAPDDPTATIDVSALPARTYGPRTGWSSPPGMLHRVIAETDYLSVEVSTPELDDVIRWQDDTARGSGRIAGEHLPGGTS